MKYRESELQRSCIKWFRLQYPQYRMALFAIPNGGARTQFGGAILKAEGMLAGTPDLFLMAQPGVFIEMKTEKGKQSDEQKKFEAMALKMGYKYEIVRNFDTFRAVILKYLL